MNIKKTTSLIAAGLFSLAGAKADLVQVPASPGDFYLIEEDTTWTADNTYKLNTFVIVAPGNTLTIEPGTTVIADTNQTANGPESRTAQNGVALIVPRGAQLIANGTYNNPILFTAEGAEGEPIDYANVDDPMALRGLWGGLILLGSATINSNGQDGVEGGPSTVGLIEGVSATVPEQYRQYGGGINDNDSSGSLRFVSIRHTGADLNVNDEIQGLTAGGLGDGTVLEYIEVFGSNDDGVEFFGGTANIKYLIVASKRDDGLDTDQGYTGNMQFVLVIDKLVDDGIVGRGGEHDGGDGDEDAQPFSLFTIANATMIGAGANIQDQLSADSDENDAVRIRDNSGVQYVNSFFTEYNGTGFRYDEDNGETTDSGERLTSGDSTPVSNYFQVAQFGDVIRKEAGEADALVMADGDDYAEFIFTDANLNNILGDKGLVGISRDTDGGLDPRIDDAAGSVALPTPATLTGDFFENVDYIGAFAPGEELWVNEWSALSQLGYVPAGSFPVAASSEALLEGAQELEGGLYDTDDFGVLFSAAPWFYSAEFGWFYSDSNNTGSQAWYYFTEEEFATWVFVDGTVTTGGDFWGFAVPAGSEVSGWFYYAEDESVADDGFYYVFEADGEVLSFEDAQ